MANIGLPSIDVIFKQLTATAISRSAKGIVAIVIKDTTDTTFDTKTYTNITELISDQAKYTADNFKILNDVFLGSPAKVIVVRIGTSGTVAQATAILQGLSFNWLTMISATPTDHNSLIVWVKSQNVVRNKPIKALTYKATVSDDYHVVNFVNDSVKRKADSASITGEKYLGRLAGIFAGLPFTRSATYYSLTDIESVVEPVDVTASINAGNLVLINDEGEPKIARAINTLQTLTSGVTDSFKKITIIEALDLMNEDIKRTFKSVYIGKYKNNYENQSLLVSSINAYFTGLATEEVLDNEYNNISFIDTETMRTVWKGKGKDVSALSDEEVAKLSIDDVVYLNGDTKVLDAIESLRFNIILA